MSGDISALPNTPSRRSAQLKRAQGQLYLYILLFIGQVEWLVVKK